MILTCSHLTSPFCLSVSILERRGLKTNKQFNAKKSLGSKKICGTVSLRWTLGCPGPMCFSTAVPGRSSPSETRICMVPLPSAARSCTVVTVGSPPAHSVLLCTIGCKCSVADRVAGGHPILSVKRRAQQIIFGAFHLLVGTAAVWLGAFIKQCCVCVCITILNVYHLGTAAVCMKLLMHIICSLLTLGK